MAVTETKPSPSKSPNLKNSSEIAADFKGEKKWKPTYQSVQDSEIFAMAKKHLNQDQFEIAMAIIEGGIQANEKNLVHEHDVPQDKVASHESMAPFHYLYGTTLLYKIEESPLIDATSISTQTEGEIQDEEKSEIQIAWENLEIARSIVEEMLDRDNDRDDVEQLQLDLAQIYLREGDLHRMNREYEAAIQDYSICLELRRGNILDQYNRKIADIHYNMALTYSQLQSAESSDEDPMANRKKSTYHYVQCARCMCGQIASLCKDVAPEDVMNVAVAHDEMISIDDGNSVMETLCTRIKDLKPNDPESLYAVNDLRQLLIEIQQLVKV